LTCFACGNKTERILRDVLLDRRAKAAIPGKYLPRYRKADPFAYGVLQRGTRKNRPGNVDSEKQQTQHWHKGNAEFDKSGARFGASKSAKRATEGHGVLKNSGYQINAAATGLIR
jgi:hypothetical protein